MQQSTTAASRAGVPARVTQLLHGTWRIADSVEADTPPETFDHAVPVPGLVHLAEPPFADAGRFVSRDLANHPLYQDPNLPPEAKTAPIGVPLQQRNYFWYRRSFTAPAQRGVALLRIAKAQFGTAVWLNGVKIGAHDDCFAAGGFDLTRATRWGEGNDLLVRVGAHPAVLPPSVPSGTDLEKFQWMPGIYDEVSIAYADNPIIESVQVAPRIEQSQIVVETVVANLGQAVCTCRLSHRVKRWKGRRVTGETVSDAVELLPGERKTLIEVITLRGVKFWTPETPHLYVVQSSTGGDERSTRFGMRDFRFDRATGWAYLNNKPYFLRGANITLHRFFEDEQCGALPWHEPWLRKLLIDIPRQMHWNSFRFCIGPVPDRWLDIADEAGLLIVNQYFFWVPNPKWGHQEWELEPYFERWVRDNCNHPSVAVWDACNETRYPGLSERVVPAVRRRDLSNRPWQLSENPPAHPDDPVEKHLYVLPPNKPDQTSFDWTRFERPPKPRPAGSNPGMVNEYGEFWLNRDGTPTTLTDHRFHNYLVGPDATAAQRFAAAAYYLAGETEYHRAYRKWAAVHHFTYLTSSYPGGYTSDNFLDVTKLELESWFRDYVGEAFKPLGVNLSFWRATLKAGVRQSFHIMMVNDHDVPIDGRLVLSLENKTDESVASSETTFGLKPFDRGTFDLAFQVPRTPGRCLLKATAIPDGVIGPTVSRRKVGVVGGG
ncbi:MAG: hypothetical protein WD009_09935 [Phycisphaeraceae bacterium]